MLQVFTVGHSSHSLPHVLSLLKAVDATAVADVRSLPASRFAPQFNRESLTKALLKEGLSYVYLGRELGARSTDPGAYVNGKVQYSRLAQAPQFSKGIQRLVDGASRERVVLMCTEQDPLDCHRAILLSPVLRERGVDVVHVLGDGTVETHEDAMWRLRRMHHLDHPSLLDSEQDLLHQALELQEAHIAYVDKTALALGR